MRLEVPNMRVTMNVTISGTRGDGTEWPARGGALDVSDAEGCKLVAGGLAIKGDGDVDADTPEPEDGPAAAPEPADAESGDAPSAKPKRTTKKAAAKKTAATTDKD